jgi:hypothetical protein
MSKTKQTVFLLLVLLSVPAAATTTSMAESIRSALCGFQTLVYTILPTLALIMFLFAGLAYAAGQVFGAEMRAKAQGWAMSLLVGGIIGIFIAVLAPILVTIFTNMSGTMTYTACP